MQIDIGILQKFTRLNINAPSEKSFLKKTIEEIQNLKEALAELGSEDVWDNKIKFLEKQGWTMEEIYAKFTD